MDKINELSTSEKLIAAGGIVMLIASFLPWYRVSFLGFSVSANGWESPGAIWSILAVIVSVALVLSVVLPKFGNVTLPDLGGVTWGQAFLAGGIAVAVFLVLKLVNHSSDLSFGFFLAILAAAAIVAGGFLAFQEEGGTQRR
jgi:hypothetical protein